MAESKKRKFTSEESEGGGEESKITAGYPSKKQKMLDDDQQIRSKDLAEDENSETSNEYNEPLSLNRLPNELLDHIFSFLAVKCRLQSERVCKRWRWLGQNVSWRSPKHLIFRDIRREIKMTTDSQVDFRTIRTEYPVQGFDHMVAAMLSRCGLNLQILTLHRKLFAPCHSKQTLRIVGEYCPNLTQLTLFNIPLDTNCVKLFSQACTKLKTLKMGKYGEIYEEDLLAILKGCQSLECLRVSICFNYVTGGCFAEASRNLKALSLLKCVHIENVALEHLMTRCNYIQDLRLSHCGRIGEASLAKVLHHYRDTLKVLHLDRWLKDINWSKIIVDLHCLETLSLCGCYNVHNGLCQSLADNCACLKSLYVRNTNINDTGLSYLVSLTNLTALDISCLPLSGQGIGILALKGRLEKLYASDVYGFAMEADQIFSPLARLCPNLQILDISGTDVTNSLVQTFRDAIIEGNLKGPVKIGAMDTEVDATSETSDSLKVVLTDVASLYTDMIDFDFEDPQEIKQVEHFLHEYEIYGY